MCKHEFYIYIYIYMWVQFLSNFFLGKDSFCGLAWDSKLSGAKYVMPRRKISLGLKGLWLGCVMANGWKFWLGEVEENGEVKGTNMSLYNVCRGW